MRSSRELWYALLIVTFVWVSLFGHWLPIRVQNILFVAVLLLEIAMIVAGWWGCIRNRNAESAAIWRKRVGLLGMIANSLAVAIPVGSLLYMMYYPLILSWLGVYLPMINAEWLDLTCVVLAFCGLIAGILAPPRSRFATALGGLIAGSIVLSIPMGIL